MKKVFFSLLVFCLFYITNGCSSGKDVSDISNLTFTPTVTMTSTFESQKTPLPQTTATDTAIPKPTNSLVAINTPVFSERFDPTTEPLGRYKPTCAGGIIINNYDGYYYFRVRKQVGEGGYCVLKPKFIHAPHGIESINIEVSYDSVDGDDLTYVGFYYSCGIEKIGVWIDDNFIYYQNELEKLPENKLKIIGELPKTENGHHVISVFWGNSIVVTVDNKEMSGNEDVLLSCPTLPKDFFYGIKAEPGKSMDAYIYNFEIFGKPPPATPTAGN